MFLHYRRSEAEIFTLVLMFTGIDWLKRIIDSICKEFNLCYNKVLHIMKYSRL